MNSLDVFWIFGFASNRISCMSSLLSHVRDAKGRVAVIMDESCWLHVVLLSDLAMNVWRGGALLIDVLAVF